uniref:caspase-8 n=1 Tax=Scatophagus argus TaxID=75038 RepID=UPI001ED83195|nr:caspase-8 [Scatophagus argus]XP_046263264.1 caspase-8 [Scatophagus argus]XP_046263265.1 caspase-8 [Scatophagus argus]
MDRLTLSRIDEELDSSEVAALCFLCRDVVNRKRLEKIEDAKGLFLRLEEKGLLENHLFLSELLRTIRRADLLNLLETDSRRPEETDSNPMLSDYRVLLYQVYEDLTKENLNKMKFLLIDKLNRRQIEACNTALDVFVEMERTGSLSNTKLDVLHDLLLKLDQQLASTVQDYRRRLTQMPQPTPQPHVSMDHQNINNTPQPKHASLSVSESEPSDVGQNVYSDAESVTVISSLYDQTEYYALSHNPRGMCVVINNEKFLGKELKNRAGTQQDECALRNLFTRLGFTMVVHNNLTADDMRHVLRELGTRNFRDHDALVVCVLSHGENGCVFGTDEEQVSLRELTQPFTSGRAPTLVGKPKLFFIQACQGSGYQRGSMPYPSASQEKDGNGSRLEEDAGRVYAETVPSDADFLLGMATVPEYKSFRNTSTGSIYIQELCIQLTKAAESPEEDDILSVLTRVNREVSKGEFLRYKQMPEPKYTLTKKLVLKFV